MEKIPYLSDFVSNPAALQEFLTDKGHHVLDLMQAHPWKSLAGVISGTALLWRLSKVHRNLPPGPPGVPIIGSLAAFANDKHLKMIDWTEKYGEVVSFYKLGQLHIILNSERIIREAFIKQAEDFSHRAEVPDMAALGVADEIFAAPYNETWKKNKKFALTTLKHYGFGTKSSVDKILEQIHQLEELLLESKGSPVNVAEDLKVMASGVMCSIVYSGSSQRGDPDPPELVRLCTEWMMGFAETGHYLTLYNQMFPRPIVAFLNKERQKSLENKQANLVAFLAKRIRAHAVDIKDRAPDDVVDAYVKERGADPDTVNTIAQTILIFLPDAIHSAGTWDLWCLYHIAHYPEVQRKLQQEVDAVCGSSRPPTLADRENMPFMLAVIAETMRLKLIIPNSFVRILKTDVSLKGYNIPKGSFVTANFAAVHYDPKVFPDPLTFNPFRFIDADGKFNNALASTLMTFSVGSRKCIGEGFYKVQVFFLLARIMQRFHIEFDPSAPAPRKEYEIRGSFVLNEPDECKMCFKPR